VKSAGEWGVQEGVLA